MTETPTMQRNIGYAVLVVAVVLAVGALGQAATFPNLAPWYASLHKPSFNPPNWIFGPVWGTLYILMAFAGWRVLRLPAATPGRATALAGFFIQLALNAGWSWLFFAAHSPTLGLIDIIPQLAVIVWTISRLYPIDRIAALCLVPLAAWVGFATLLNVAIWRLNGA